MKLPLSLAIAGAIVAGAVPAAFALTTSGSSSSQGQAYISPYGTFYQNGSVASMNSSPSSLSSYDHYLYGSSSSTSVPSFNTYTGIGSSSSSSSAAYPNNAALNGGFQGLSCLGMTGQDFLNCLQQYGVTSTPGSLLFQNGSSSSGFPSLTCDQYTGTQQSQCRQQLIDFWRSYNASLQIWLTQLQKYIQGLMAQANISPTEVGSMTGSSLSASSSPAQTEAAIKQYWQVCGKYGFPEQQRCMHDALTDQTRYQDWVKDIQQLQMTPNNYGSSGNGNSNYPYLPAGTYPSGNMGNGIYNGSLNIRSNTDMSAGSTTNGGSRSSY